MSSDEIFTVFISSSQNEFAEFRKNLKERINSERFLDRRVMRAVLIEEERGPVIASDIREELDRCALYVGIFGREKSEWTFTEYREARARGLPLLIYKLIRRRRGRRISEQRGRKSAVQQFLEQEVKSIGVRIRSYTSEDEIEEAILDDLSVQVAKLVNEATNVRKLINRGLAPPRTA